MIVQVVVALIVMTARAVVRVQMEIAQLVAVLIVMIAHVVLIVMIGHVVKMIATVVHHGVALAVMTVRVISMKTVLDVKILVQPHNAVLMK
jgi:hypothetical protein